jgi:tripartite-type tricarboxylate transporter receptor subunit TctC
MKTTLTIAALGALAVLGLSTAEAAWKPTKNIEFIVTAGPGGGTDQFARTVQAIAIKYNLLEQSVIVLNKGGGSGAEGFVYAKSAAGDPHKVVFATSNEWMLPMVAKLAFKHDDLRPVAAMAMDEFLLWVRPDLPYTDAKSYIAAVKAKPGDFKMGGSQSKDVDQLLVRLLEKATGAKFTYIPFKSGGEAAVQLAGSHIDSNTNNPAENIGQWKAGAGKPLCVFSPKRMTPGPKVTETMAWSDIPTCKESGIPLEQFQMPRTVFLPGGTNDEAIAYYVNLLKQVREKPEWADYITRGSQSNIFLDDKGLKAFIAEDEVKARAIFKEEGWLVN